MSNKRRQSQFDKIEEDYKAAYIAIMENVGSRITNKSDFTKVLHQTGRHPTTKVLDKLWKPDTRSISFSEFVRICEELPPTSTDDLMKAFSKMDVNGDGFISKEEFMKAMTSKGDRMSRKDVDTIISKVDVNRDGKLNFDEFTQFLLSNVDTCKQAAVQHKAKIENVTSNSQNQKDVLGDSRKNSLGSSSRQDRRSRGSVVAQSPMNGDDDDDIVIGESKPALPTLTKGGASSITLEKSFGGKFDHIKPPRNIANYKFSTTRRGCFFFDEAVEHGKVLLSYGYSFSLSQPATVYITIKPLEGLHLTDLKTTPDLGFLILQNDRVICMSEQATPDGHASVHADLSVGSYRLIALTSEAKFRSREFEPKTKAKLLKKDMQGKLALTTAFKEALSDIFAVSDLDGNGKLSIEEFAVYTLRTCGEVLDDDSWVVVKETCNLVDGEIVLDDFIHLNLREAEEDNGDETNLWVTLENTGFNKQLFNDESFAYVFDIKVDECQSLKLQPIEFEATAPTVLKEAICNFVMAKGDLKHVPGPGGISIYSLYACPRVLIVVKATQRSLVRLNCTKSRNFVNSQEDARIEKAIQPNKSEILLHGVSVDPQNSIHFSSVIESKT